MQAITACGSKRTGFEEEGDPEQPDWGEDETKPELPQEPEQEQQPQHGQDFPGPNAGAPLGSSARP